MKLEKTTMNGQKFLSVLSAGLAVVFGLGAAVEATSHAVGWTFGNLGSSSYRLNVFEPD